MRVSHNVVIASLDELADEDFQRRVWTGDSEGTQSNFTECVESLFSDSGLGQALGAGAVYGADFDDDLRELSRLVNAVSHDRGPAALLGDPILARIRLVASQLVTRIRPPTG